MLQMSSPAISFATSMPGWSALCCSSLPLCVSIRPSVLPPGTRGTVGAASLPARTPAGAGLRRRGHARISPMRKSCPSIASRTGEPVGSFQGRLGFIVSVPGGGPGLSPHLSSVFLLLFVSVAFSQIPVLQTGNVPLSHAARTNI